MEREARRADGSIISDRPIRELDSITVDKIAAGEVVERPVHVVKELLENAVDAGADAITVEIENGGISMIRITDNGKGIPRDQVRTAFLRHATSKIERIEDLFTLHSLGFRGEALSSIAAVARVEMITRRAQELTGTRYVIEGGKEISLEEVGAPEGTTIVVRDLFFNTPAREKFLKKPQTEGSYVAELVEHLCLAHPQISIRFIANHADRFHTSGNGDLKEIIYRIYGRETASHLVPFSLDEGSLQAHGFLGEPAICRGSRSFEQFFVNNRYIRDKVLASATEEGYRAYLMQHRFPFVVLKVEVPADEVDVNVHPSKMEVRFADPVTLSAILTERIAETLHAHEMIPDTAPEKHREKTSKPENAAESSPAEPFEKERRLREQADGSPASSAHGSVRPVSVQTSTATVAERTEADEPDGTCIVREKVPEKDSDENNPFSVQEEETRYGAQPAAPRSVSDDPVRSGEKSAATQTSLFDGASPAVDAATASEDRILSAAGVRQFKVLGQLFNTFWVIEYRDQLLLMDQHAAHEKVNYERMMKRYHEKEPLTQMIAPPVLLTLTPREEAIYAKFASVFAELGFEIEDFGDRTIALRGVPVDIYGADSEQSFFLEVLDELAEETGLDRDPKAVTGRIAGMACKASVKGNTRMTLEEVEALLDEMLTLENPYHCPHGRPTVVTMSRADIEKRFKRIVD